ncbi:hypothetical protein [Chromobacterium paludis]|nr:hypothetical protein [Chromobacterium paludis]
MPERTKWPAFVVLDLPEPLAGAVPDSEAGRLLALPTPAGRVMLRQVSVYAPDAQRHCHLLHRAYLAA